MRKQFCKLSHSCRGWPRPAGYSSSISQNYRFPNEHGVGVRADHKSEIQLNTTSSKFIQSRTPHPPHSLYSPALFSFTFPLLEILLPPLEALRPRPLQFFLPQAPAPIPQSLRFSQTTPLPLGSFPFLPPSLRPSSAPLYLSLQSVLPRLP